MPHPAHNLFNTHRALENEGLSCNFYSLPALAEAGIGSIATLPVSLRILLESLLRNYDGHQITEDDIVKFGKLGGAFTKSRGDTLQAGTRGRTRLHRCAACCRYRRNAFRCCRTWR